MSAKQVAETHVTQVCVRTHPRHQTCWCSAAGGGGSVGAVAPTGTIPACVINLLHGLLSKLVRSSVDLLL